MARLLFRLALFVVSAGLTACSGTGQAASPLTVQPQAATARTAALAERDACGAKKACGITAISVTLPHANLPLGQSETISVTAVCGGGPCSTYDNPIVLSAPGASFSPASLTSPGETSSVVTWNNGLVKFPAVTIDATADGKHGRATLEPASGFEYYTVGSNPAYDAIGLRALTGPDGMIYYSNYGPTQCDAGGFCFSAAGALGRIDPATGEWSEIDIPSEVSGLYFSSDGALWFGGGPNGPLYHIPAGAAFTLTSVQSIPLPVDPGGSAHQVITGITGDAAGKVWFTDASGHEYFSIPVAGPYTTAAITQYAAPYGAAGSPQLNGNLQGIDFAKDGNVYAADFVNGSLDRIAPSSGSVTGQYVTPEEILLAGNDVTEARFLTTWNGRTLFLTQAAATGTSGPTYEGSIDIFDPASATFQSTVALPSSPIGVVPDSIRTAGRYVYFADLNNGIGVFDANATRTGQATAWVFPNSTTAEYDAASSAGNDSPLTADGVALDSKGDAWFTCYNAVPNNPACMGRIVYKKDWSIFPAQDFTIGVGSANAQLFGLVENPKRDSAPFTFVSASPSLCTVSGIPSTAGDNHNFTVTGVAPTNPGSPCLVTVTDINGLAQTLDVTVTSSSSPASAARTHQARSSRRFF